MSFRPSALEIIENAIAKKSTKIELRNFQLTSLPERFRKLACSIEEIDLSYNPLTSESLEILSDFAYLTKLTLISTNIRYIPETIKKLPN